MTRSETAQHARDVMLRVGYSQQQVEQLLQSFQAAGLSLAHDAHDELVCRWIDVEQRAVPGDADTIIRTITTTITTELGDRIASKTHWLEGLRSPRGAVRL